MDKGQHVIAERNSPPLQARSQEGSRLKRLVVVTDNAMMVGAMRAGLQDGRAFELLGYLDPRRATAAIVRDTGADVVLVDEADSPDQAIALIRSIKEDNEHLNIVFLAIRMAADCLERAFEAGACSAISKAIHPGALATFLDEALKGHIVHAPACIASHGEAPDALAAEHLSLTSRELGILQLVAAGATNREIAQQLWITCQTVKFHLSNIYRKLGVSNRTGACHYAHVNGVLAGAGASSSMAPWRSPRVREAYSADPLEA